MGTFHREGGGCLCALCEPDFQPKGGSMTRVEDILGETYALVKEIADGKWDGGITATALRERAQRIVYGSVSPETWEKVRKPDGRRYTVSPQGRADGRGYDLAD